MLNGPVCPIIVDILGGNMGFRELRRDHPIEELDYQLLMSYLSDYAKPRDKITRLITAGKIIPVKKGLYVFGKDYRKGLVCKEVLANLIYGPSYISREYALAYYGLIPERVEELTSVTTGKQRCFDTSLGRFSYKKITLKRYSVGVLLNELDSKHQFFIASPEKALIDHYMLQKGLADQKSIEEYLHEDLRIEPSDLKRLNLSELERIAECFPRNRMQKLLNYLKGVLNE